jgi:hypothetical protein
VDCRKDKKIVFEGAKIGVKDRLRGKREWMEGSRLSN